MACCNPSYSSWLSPRAPLFSPGSAKLQSLFFCFCSKSTNICNSCSTNTGPTNDLSSATAASHTRSRPYHQTSPDILRHWIEADQDPPLASSQERFTVVSYNILGDRNASKHRDLYQNVPFNYLKWAYRKRVICRELIGWNPDIICLQEVDKYYDLLKAMEKAGYAGSYKQRRTGDNVDGCAMFWKADTFQLLEGESIEFERYGLRDNVAQLSVFEICRDESRRILIGNIHVLYNPSRGDVKLGQIRFLLSRAQILAEKWGNIPAVLAGDFNSIPQSAIYKFLSLSEVSFFEVFIMFYGIPISSLPTFMLNIMPYDRRELSGQRNCDPAKVFGVKKEMSSPLFFMDKLLKNYWTDEEVKVATGNVHCHLVAHPFKLNSTYATVNGSTKTRDFSGEPLATSYHSKFLGTVDYLWYSDGIVPTRVLDTLPLDILRRTGGLPCQKLGSDHLALVSEFAFTQGTKEGNTTSTTISAATTSAFREDNDWT